MDPNYITTANWAEFFGVIFHIFLFVVFNVIAALSFLTSHAIIRSLVTSNHIPASVGAVRPVLYAISLVAFAIAVYQFYLMVTTAIPTIGPIFPQFTY